MMADSLLGRLHVRRAVLDDLSACDQIARLYPDQLGWVRRAALSDALAAGSLHVASVDDEIGGFVEFRRRRDGVSVIYTLAVDQRWHGRGVGRALLYSVPCPLRLKVTADNPANDFYAGAGLRLVGTEPGRRRPLNVYERRIFSLWVQGNNRDVPGLARAAGMGYGTRHDMIPRDVVHMLDIRWDDYDWNDYLDKVRRWRPLMALAADYLSPDQRSVMLQQVEDLRAAGVLVVMVCPKFVGACADVPADCRIAVSVPSRYAGFLPDPIEVGGRPVHLLGGSPQVQIKQIQRYNVVSLDGNAHDRAAQFGAEFSGGRWRRPVLDRVGTKDRMNAIRLRSSLAIVRETEAAAQIQQLPLFG